MLLTLFPMVTLARLVQPKKALLPISVTLFGMVILVSCLQPEKALSPMLATLFGMVNELPVLPNVNKLRIKRDKKEADYKTGGNKMLKKTYHSGKEQRK